MDESFLPGKYVLRISIMFWTGLLGVVNLKSTSSFYELTAKRPKSYIQELYSGYKVLSMVTPGHRDRYDD